MKIGIIGYGNMGSMITNNILKLNLLLDNEELIVSNRHIEKIKDLKNEYPNSNLRICSDNKELAKISDKIIICVETPQFKGIIQEIEPYLTENTHIIHTCAGLNFKHINSFYNGKLSLIIPTIASSIPNDVPVTSPLRKKGVSLIQHNSKLSNDEKNYIEDLFNEFSYVKVLNNKNKNNNDVSNANINNANANNANINNDNTDASNNTTKNTNYNNNPKLKNQDLDLETSTILTSCGPAFIALLIKKIAEISSEKSELNYNETEEMITKTILGTCLLKDSENLANEYIMNKVATKKGITQEGIDYLDKEIDKIATELIDHLLNRYQEVKLDLDKKYS